MYFYEVYVRSNHYHGKQALTYSANKLISLGSLVNVPMKDETVVGVVISKVNFSRVKTKKIISVLELPPLPKANLELMDWLKNYYPAPIGVLTSQFIPPNLNNLKPDQPHTKITALFNTDSLPKLTSEQKLAFDQMKDNDTYLLHGRTGSGKTRIYLELAKDTLNQNRSVIILTPEISLTTQLANQFNQLFKDRVVVIHSMLTPKQRAERWSFLLKTQLPLVVIGPRSVIFSPLANIGLIIIDEEHEPAYKQEQAPYYMTSRVASKLRSLTNSKLILGSATPLVTDYFMALNRNKPIIRLSKLAKKTTANHLITSVVDCKDRSLFNRSSFVSQPLIEAIESSLNNSNQTLLYLNRRGTARIIICDQCDWQAKCPRCDLPLTYHGDNHILRCHICGFFSQSPINCPSCNNPSIRYLSIGTKAVVNEISRLFPAAKVQRFDADNTKADRFEQNYDKIKQGDVDIIIGTQLLAKGLDLPKLSVVGVLLADTSLQIPDYTSTERTYQLLSQVIGRVGRGHTTGTALIQTYQPDNEVILSALTDNWGKFYTQEINERREYNFPPFVHLLKLSVARTTAKSAETAARKFAQTLSSEVIVEGPAPELHEKQANKSHWQLVIKAKSRDSLIQIINRLPPNWHYDIDPNDLI